MKDVSIDDLFLPILDFIEVKKSTSLSAILKEIQIDFAEVELTALEHNVLFCLSKMLEAELISQQEDFFSLTKKGIKVLRQRQHKITLKEIEFYIEHDENYFGKPTSHEPPEKAFKLTFKALRDNPNIQKIAFLLISLLLFYAFILRIGVRSIEDGANILTKPFDQGIEETNKAIKKLEEQP
jgi:hypothetical protein